MQVQELQIGDWVNVFGIPKQMEGTREFRNGDKVVYYDGDNGNFIENVTPIPITPEILKKNGFELKPDGLLWCEFGYEYQNYIFIQFRKGCKEVRTCELNFTNKAFLSFKPRYVHELQHVLKICEIEKEIIL